MEPFYSQSWFLWLLGLFGTLVTIAFRSVWMHKVDRWLETTSSRKQRFTESLMVEGLRNVANLYAAMEIILRLPKVDRVLLLKVSNDGSRPRPGTKIYARAVEVKVYDEEDKKHLTRLQILDEYKKIEVDEAYLQMVDYANDTQKAYEFDVENHKDCLLKHIYRSEGVKFAQVWHVHSDPHKWEQFILSVATFDPNERFKDVEDSSTILTCVHRIRQTLSNYR